MSSYCETNSFGTKRWLNEQSQLHREDGPAVEYTNGFKCWYLNGIEVEEKDVMGPPSPRYKPGFIFSTPWEGKDVVNKVFIIEHWSDETEKYLCRCLYWVENEYAKGGFAEYVPEKAIVEAEEYNKYFKNED